MKIDIIIPSCKEPADYELQMAQIKKTRFSSGNIIFTGKKASASINRNTGLNASNTDIVIMMDDDMTGFYWGWDIDLVRPLMRDSDILISSARLMNENGKPAYTMIENYDLTVDHICSKKIPTACIAFRKTDLRFDELFIGSGFEDDDFCRQMLQKYGYDKYFVTANNCKLVHLNEAKNQSGTYWDANKAYFQRKWATQPGKPIALCKVWRGKEFAIPALEALYHHVEKIVFVHSDISWCGEMGNDVKPIVEAWAKSHDNENKIINLDFNSQDQLKQYNFGLEYINKNFDNDLCLFFDTDEVWEAADLQNLLKFAAENPEANCYCCPMHTYIKSPFYRISPPEPVNPIVLYRLKSNSFQGHRGCATRGRAKVPHVKFHHFTYVREDWNALLQKMENIYKVEADAYGHIDFDVWKKEKWDKLPHATDFHTAKGYEHFWKGVQVVELKELPVSVRECEIVKKWM